MPGPSNIGLNRNKPPTEGEPCLLARSVLELREEVRWYLSFTDEEIFKGVPLPKEEESLQTPGATSFPKAPCMPEPVLERKSPKVCRMGKSVTPILASGGCWKYPSTYQDPKTKGGGETDPSDDINEATSLPSGDPYSASALTLTHALVLAQPPTPPCSFAGVTACLCVPKLVEVDLEPPVGIVPLELVTALGIASMSSSHIMRDELMGVTYMDMVMTSIGRGAISGLGQETCPTGPTIEDIMDCQ